MSHKHFESISSLPSHEDLQREKACDHRSFYAKFRGSGIGGRGARGVPAPGSRESRRLRPIVFLKVRQFSSESAGGDPERKEAGVTEKEAEGRTTRSRALSSRTSKGNSRNYGDFSEEFREIDVIPRVSPPCLSCSLSGKTDKPGFGKAGERGATRNK
ncbi:hypothetical protein KM043_011511 [Ampulex compressa]|nr:hypothetical protein KM043_011511 [Ampulex compressa]